MKRLIVIINLTLLTLFALIFLDAKQPEFLSIQAQEQPTELPPFPTATPSFVTSTPLPFPTRTPLPTATATAAPTHVPGEKVVNLTCHAEPKWSYLIEVRRGPNEDKWGIVRELAHNSVNHEMRVFGRTEDYSWYQVVLAPPNDNIVGWVKRDVVNVFGVCSNLPVTDDHPIITPEEVPPAPDLVPLPDFAKNVVALTPPDRAYLLKPGILYIRREVWAADQKDRVQAHIILMDLKSPQLRVSVTIGAVPGVGGTPVSQMSRDANAFIGITGDYYAGNYFPQGLTVINGEVVTAPKQRAAFGLSYDRQPFIGYFTRGWTWPAYVVATNGEVIPLQLMNVPCDLAWLCMYTYHRANYLPGGTGDIRVVLDEHNVVQNIILDSRGVEIPDGYAVLRGGLQAGEWLLANVHVGDSLQIVRPTDPDWQNYETVIGGGPRLLDNGVFWDDCYPVAGDFCEEFDFEYRDSHYGLKSLPRTAVGYNADGTILYAIATEGYEVEDSGGTTRWELANLFLEFGALNAMEFDGGGSTSMYIFPSQVTDYGYEGERRVSDALLFYWDE